MNDKAELVQLIRCNMKTRGDGSSLDSPIRRIDQFFTLDGMLLCEGDPLAENIGPEQKKELKQRVEKEIRNWLSKRMIEKDCPAEYRLQMDDFLQGFFHNSFWQIVEGVLGNENQQREDG